MVQDASLLLIHLAEAMLSRKTGIRVLKRDLPSDASLLHKAQFRNTLFAKSVRRGKSHNAAPFRGEQVQILLLAIGDL